MKGKTVVFVHGMYMTPLCWEHWVRRFKQAGYNCLDSGMAGTRPERRRTCARGIPTLRWGGSR